jgi:hypothetical protein
MMAAGIPLLPLVLSAAIGGATTLVGRALSPKPPKPIAPVATPTVSAARSRADRTDVLSRRRGTEANRRVGYGAGEAFTGPRVSLLGRS